MVVGEGDEVEDDEDPMVEGSTIRRKRGQLCNYWLQEGRCRYYGDMCMFAHGQQELTRKGKASYGAQYKNSFNCKMFHKQKVCMEGEHCMFRHEQRHIDRIHRHHYISGLNVLETVFGGA